MRIRRGISLIEVLFSIGIVGIGLLGVLLLVPLAMRQVGQGNEFDRTSRMGLNALSEFEIRGMADVDNLRYYNPLASAFFSVAPPLPPYLLQSSFAVDPLALSLTANQNAAGSVFPANSPSWMPRYTLRSIPQPLALPMSSLHADRLFILRDELVFNVPGDQTLPPVQVFNWGVGPDGQWGAATVDDDLNGTVDDGSEAGAVGSDDVVVSRQNGGEYSWMATVTPKFDTRSTPENFAHDYTLSIIVFHHRDFNVTNGVSERVVDVAQIYGDGTGGGDVLLRTTASAVSPAKDLQGIREGHWLMLGAQLPVYGGGSNINYFSWYRIDGVDDEPLPNGSNFELNVTLAGPDWPLAMTVKPAGSATGTQAAIIKNVAAVYQKVIHLETSSLWSN